jgi:hypothetical protein
VFAGFQGGTCVVVVARMKGADVNDVHILNIRLALPLETHLVVEDLLICSIGLRFRFSKTFLLSHPAFRTDPLDEVCSSGLVI